MSEKCWNCGTTPNIRCCEFGRDLEPTPIDPRVKMETMARIYPNLKHHKQVSENFGLKGGTLLVEFLTYEDGDPVGPAGMTCSKIIHTAS